MPSSFIQAVVFIVNTLTQLYLFVLLLRLLLPYLGADFRNPIAQAILKLTSPLVIPLRRIIPPIGRIDTATLVVAFAIQYLLIFVLLLILGSSATIAAIAINTKRVVQTGANTESGGFQGGLVSVRYQPSISGAVAIEPSPPAPRHRTRKTTRPRAL